MKYKVGDKVVLNFKGCGNDIGDIAIIIKVYKFAYDIKVNEYTTFINDTMIDHEATAKLNEKLTLKCSECEIIDGVLMTKLPKYRIKYECEFIGEEKMKKFEKVIFNEPATIVMWEDKTKTVVKAMDEDTFDPERGFLQAYFEKTSGMSRTQCNKMLADLRKQYEDMNIVVKSEEYEVGDEVVIRKDLKLDVDYGADDIVEEMIPFLGKVVTVSEKIGVKYHIEEDDGRWSWTNEMINHEATARL